MRIPSQMKLSLKTARELNKLTQKAAAKEIGVSADTLRKYEKGETYPDVPVIKAIENLYGIKYDQLIFLPL